MCIIYTVLISDMVQSFAPNCNWSSQQPKFAWFRVGTVVMVTALTWINKVTKRQTSISSIHLFHACVQNMSILKHWSFRHSAAVHGEKTAFFPLRRLCFSSARTQQYTFCSIHPSFNNANTKQPKHYSSNKHRCGTRGLWAVEFFSLRTNNEDDISWSCLTGSKTRSSHSDTLWDVDLGWLWHHR